MTARKAATKTAVAASREFSSTARRSPPSSMLKPLASFKAETSIRSPATGRSSSHNPNYEDLPREIPRAASQAASVLESPGPVIRDSLPAAIERSFESLRALHLEVERMDDATVPMRSSRQSFPSTEFDFTPERNLLESLNMINAHIRTATAQITELREQLDI